MELKFRSKISYKLNQFSYCRILNDTVRSASIMRSSNTSYLDKYDERRASMSILMPIIEKPFLNAPCDAPIVAIRKWKHWLYKPVYEYKVIKKCTPINY